MYPSYQKGQCNFNTKEACIRMANQLIQITKARIPKIVNIKNITPDFIRVMYFKLCEPHNKDWLKELSWEEDQATPKQRHRHLRWFLKPVSSPTALISQGIINSLEQRLGIPLSHIRGSDVAAGDPVSLHDLLEVLVSCHQLSVISSHRGTLPVRSTNQSSPSPNSQGLLNSVPSLSEGFDNLSKTFSSHVSSVAVESLKFPDDDNKAFSWRESKENLSPRMVEPGEEQKIGTVPRCFMEEAVLDPWCTDNSDYWDPPPHPGPSLSNILSSTDMQGKSCCYEEPQSSSEDSDCSSDLSSDHKAGDHFSTSHFLSSPEKLQLSSSRIKHRPRMRVTSDVTFKIRNELLQSRNQPSLVSEGYGGSPAVSPASLPHIDCGNALAIGQLRRKVCPRRLGVPIPASVNRHCRQRSVQDLAQVLDNTAASSQTKLTVKQAELGSLHHLADTTEQLYRRLCLKKRMPVTRRIYTPSCQKSVLLPRVRRSKPPPAPPQATTEEEDRGVVGLEGDLRRHFPFVEISRPTLTLLGRQWRQELRLVESRAADLLAYNPSSKFVAEQVGRQKKLTQIAQRDLLSSLTLSNVREKRKLELAAQSSLQTARLRNVHLRRYYHQFLREFRRRAALTRCRGEMRVATAVKESWKARRMDFFSLCRQHSEKLQQTHLELATRFFSLQHYYEDQCSLLQEQLTRDHSQLETRVRAQQLATAQIKRELRQATEKSLQELQDQVLNSLRDLGPLEDQLKTLSLS